MKILEEAGIAAEKAFSKDAEKAPKTIKPGKMPYRGGVLPEGTVKTGTAHQPFDTIDVPEPKAVEPVAAPFKTPEVGEPTAGGLGNATKKLRSEAGLKPGEPTTDAIKVGAMDAQSNKTLEGLSEAESRAGQPAKGAEGVFEKTEKPLAEGEKSVGDLAKEQADLSASLERAGKVKAGLKTVGKLGLAGAAIYGVKKAADWFAGRSGDSTNQDGQANPHSVQQIQTNPSGYQSAPNGQADSSPHQIKEPYDVEKAIKDSTVLGAEPETTGYGGSSVDYSHVGNYADGGRKLEPFSVSKHTPTNDEMATIGARRLTGDRPITMKELNDVERSGDMDVANENLAADRARKLDPALAASDKAASQKSFDETQARVAFQKERMAGIAKDKELARELNMKRMAQETDRLGRFTPQAVAIQQQLLLKDKMAADTAVAMANAESPVKSAEAQGKAQAQIMADRNQTAKDVAEIAARAQEGKAGFKLDQINSKEFKDELKNQTSRNVMKHGGNTKKMFEESGMWDRLHTGDDMAMRDAAIAGYLQDATEWSMLLDDPKRAAERTATLYKNAGIPDGTPVGIPTIALALAMLDNPKPK